MVNVPSFVNVPTFGSIAAKTQPPGGTYSGGYLPGQVFPAEHENWFMAGLTENGNTEQTSIISVVSELAYLLTTAGVTPASGLTTQVAEVINSPVGLGIAAMGMTVDYEDWYQLDRHIIARSFPVGVNLYSDIPLTQVIVSASRSSANPSFPDYCPVIARDVDKTVTTTEAPLLVPLYRAVALVISGTSSFTGTVSGATITFSNTTTNNNLLAAMLEEALVRRWFSTSQSPTFAASGGDFTGMTMNVAGVDYAVTDVNTGTRVVTVTGSPTTGSQTCIIYPYRIVGSTTSVQLPRLAGFVPVGSGDVDDKEVGGYRHMDYGQGHKHPSPTYNGTSQPFGTKSGTTTVGSTGTPGSFPAVDLTDVPYTDGTNGPPRTGKNTTARSAARFIYTWAGDLEAAV